MHHSTRRNPSHRPGTVGIVPFPVKGFTQIDNTAVAMMVTHDLSRAAILVYLVLCQYAHGRKAYAWPGTATLMRETELSRPTVERARRDLAEVGLIEKSERSPAGTIHYRLPTLAACKGTLTDEGTLPSPVMAKEEQKKKKRISPPRSPAGESKAGDRRRTGPAADAPPAGGSATDPEPDRQAAAQAATAMREAVHHLAARVAGSDSLA